MYLANSLPARRLERGFNLIGTIVAAAIMITVGLGILGALSIAFKSSRDSEPKLVGQTAVSNVQTDLSAITMYDSSSISSLSGKTFSVTPPSPPAGTNAYPPADTKPTTVKVNSSSGSGTSATLQVTYSVPNQSGGTSLTGNSTISIYQKAPNGCDSRLVGTGATLPDGTAC